MLRSGSPGLVRQELAAWAAATEMTRGVARDAALAAAPARKGRRAGQPVQPREISFARARRAVLAAIRPGHDRLHRPLTSEIAKYRTIIDRNRHRARKAKSAQHLPPRRRADTATRIAPAVITLGQHASLTSANTGSRPRTTPAGPWNRPSPGTTRRPPACPHQELPTVTKTRNLARNTQIPKPHGIGRAPAPHLAIRSPGITRRRRNKIGRMLIWLSLQAVAWSPHDEPMTLTLRSPAFESGAPIPARFDHERGDLSPALGSGRRA